MGAPSVHQALTSPALDRPWNSKCDLMAEFGIAFALVSLSFALQGNIGLDLADEGYLWNGTLRVAQGKIPIRDFRAYDPGRYYWSFAWSKLFGLGVLGVRRAAAVFQFFGLWAGLLAASRAIESFWLLTLAGILVTWWMHPRHKYFEHSVTLLAVFMAVRLIESPSLTNCFLSGLFVGISTFMGINHGLYGIVSYGLLFPLISIEQGFEDVGSRVGMWLAGAVLGYSPMFAMWLAIPGMLRSFWSAKVLSVMHRGTTNLGLPAPWPWRAQQVHGRLLDRLSRFFLGIHFLFLPFFYVVVVAWVLLAGSPGEQPLLTASAVIGTVYMHHAFSRADLPHLCQAMQPFLLAALSVVFAASQPIATAAGFGALICAAFFTLRGTLPLMSKLNRRSNLVEYELHGEKLQLDQGLARMLDSLRLRVDQLVPAEDSIFIAPMTATLYPVLKRETPVRSDFLVYPEADAAQKQIIQDLESKPVRWALIDDVALDGRDELRFRNTHPLVWSYIESCFKTIPVVDIGQGRQLFRRVKHGG